MEFKPFPKIPRLSRDCVITEKLDGTNASVTIVHKDHCDPEWSPDLAVAAIRPPYASPAPMPYHYIFAGSRNRFVTPGKETDNFGFAAWVADHAWELLLLGLGTHYGEWWGQGIQRGYGLNEKRFSLFNTGRWRDRHDPQTGELLRTIAGEDAHLYAPACCHVVPVLWRGPFAHAFDQYDGNSAITWEMSDLSLNGSRAAPGFMNPEGIIIYHTAANQYFKKTFVGDGAGKGVEGYGA